MALHRLPDFPRLMPLQQLVYVSVASVPTRSAMDVSDILAQSVPANRAHGVTGVLGFTDRHFVQLLEGRQEVLDALLANLGQDTRHREVKVIGRTLVGQRDFADWFMLAPVFTPSGRMHLKQLVAKPVQAVDEYRGLFLQMIREQAHEMAATRQVNEASPNPG
jgi:hypothetical protein